jgi:uncharacterized protein (DUF952 family)
MRTIVVATTRTLWEEAQETGTYTRSTIDTSFETDGFIHATAPEQTIAMLNRHFTQRDDVLLLLVDVDKVRSEVKFEAALSGRPGLFPHIYGPLNIDAIYDVITATKDAAGAYIEPKELAAPPQD